MNIAIFMYFWDFLGETKIKNIARIDIAKNRDGTIGTVYLDYYPEFCKLADREY